MQTSVLKISLMVFVGIAIFAFADSGFAQEIAVITHKNNTENMSMETLKNYFTGLKTHYENGKAVMIIDREPGAPVRAVFLRKVVEMDAQAWDQHWLEMKSKSGRSKPKQTRSTKFIIRLVSRRDGAIGYVQKKDLDEKSRKIVRVIVTLQ